MARPGRRSLLVGAGVAALVPAARAQGRTATFANASTSFATVAVRAAHQMGLFAARGITPRIVTLENANAATSALLAGSADFAVSGPGELVAVRARNLPVVLVTDIYRGFSGSVVLAKSVAAQTGVAPAAPAAARIRVLDGLLIAGPSATSAYTVSYKGAAEAAGVRMRFAFMGQNAMGAALESGAVQGFIGGAPFWGIAVARGVGVLWLSGPKGELPPANVPVSTASIQTTRSIADTNPGLVRDVADAMRAFAAAVETQPGRVKEALAALYPDIDPETMDVLFATESRAWITRPLTPDDMRHEIEFIRSGGSVIPGLDRVDPASMLLDPGASRP